MAAYQYCTTAFLWRELKFLKSNREKMEDVAAATGIPILYHKRRREILTVLAKRTKGRRKEAA